MDLIAVGSQGVMQVSDTTSRFGFHISAMVNTAPRLHFYPYVHPLFHGPVSSSVSRVIRAHLEKVAMMPQGRCSWHWISDSSMVTVLGPGTPATLGSQGAPGSKASPFLWGLTTTSQL